MTYGERLRQARKRAGLLQREVADRVGVATDTVGRWEREHETPSQPYADALSELLMVDVPAAGITGRARASDSETSHGHDVYPIPGSISLFPGVYARWGCHDCAATWESPLTVEELDGVECEAESERRVA